MNGSPSTFFPNLLRATLIVRRQPGVELVVTYQEDVKVFEGHPFIVEDGVCLGSKRVKKPGIIVFHFANHIPMLFDIHLKARGA
jgi:DNA topoisomerase VI subunit B